MRDTKAHRANTIQSDSVNVTFGYTFVHSKRASYSSQPDVLPGHRTFAHSGSLHAAARSRSISSSCPPFRLFPTPLQTRKSPFQFPTRFVDLLFALYLPNTQFVNRLIPFFSILHFVHDERPLRGAVPCAFRSRVLLCLIFRPVRRRTPAQIHALVTKRQNLHLIIRPE